MPHSMFRNQQIASLRYFAPLSGPNLDLPFRYRCYSICRSVESGRGLKHPLSRQCMYVWEERHGRLTGFKAETHAQEINKKRQD
jgi:hypothetical protein